MSTPLPFQKLREVARTNNSVNVDLASYYELRWHDDHFVTIWKRWETARSAWRNHWYEAMPMSLWRGLDVYDPKPETLPEPHAAMAREFIESRKLYLGTLDHYLQEGVEEPS